MKRILTVLLAAVLLLGLLLPLVACSEDKEKSKKDDEDEETSAEGSSDNSDETSGGATPDDSYSVPENALVFDGNSTFKPGKPEEKLDPEEIYENLSYTPQMFYGSYRILGGKDGLA